MTGCSASTLNGAVAKGMAVMVRRLLLTERWNEKMKIRSFSVRDGKHRYREGTTRKKK